MVMRPKHVAVTKYNIQTSVALDGNPEPEEDNFKIRLIPPEDGHKTELP
jgi:hypothetical protein